MTDIKILKDDVKSKLDNKTVAEILSFIGYEITRDFKFRNDPSFSIARNGFIKDFGATGFSGDIFDFLMQEQNISLPTAIKYVADCLGIKYE